MRKIAKDSNLIRCSHLISSDLSSFKFFCALQGRVKGAASLPKGGLSCFLFSHGSAANPIEKGLPTATVSSLSVK